MTEWWNSLNIVLQFFYAVGILSLTVVIIQLLMTLIGFDGHSADGIHDVNLGDLDHGSGIGVFSAQTISAFFVAFGWVGVAVTKSGIATPWGVLIAFVSGLLSMFLMYRMLRGLLRLQAKGNLDYQNAVGEVGTVYVTIPGSDRDGGQIQVNFQGRLTTASARKASPGELKPGQRVRIVGLNGPTDFMVEDATAAKGPSDSP